MENNNTSYTDEVGGMHDEGTGYNPQGVWCGECSNMTCKGCVNEHLSKSEENALNKQSREIEKRKKD